MKVQVITSLFPLPWQPTREIFNRQQFEHLAKSCEVSVLVVVPWLVYLRKWRELRPGQVGSLRVRYLCFFTLPGLARVLNPWFLCLTLLPRWFTLRRDRPDCLLLSWAYPDAVAGVVLARLLGRPAFIKVHGSDINMHCQYPARAAQVLWAMRQARGVLCVSRDLADKLRTMGVPEEKLKVLYNGVNHALFHSLPRSEARTRLGLPSDRRLLLFIGNLKLEKGCVDLFEAFKGLAPRRADLTLCYIGTGKQADTLRQRAAAAGLGERVQLLGAVPHAELRYWINASDLVSLPSHAEGVPNVLLEAMACGVPVVATRVGGIPEVVPAESGLTVELGDGRALEQALEACLAQDWNPERIGARVRGLTWDDNARQLRAWLQGQPVEEPSAASSSAT